MTRERRMDNSEWPAWLHKAWNEDRGTPGSLSPSEFPNSDGTDKLVIQTLEGQHLVEWNDWIIRGIQEELYPCKPDIFEATYGPENDTFTGWNKFPDVKPSYDFDAIVEFEDGGMWIAAWKDDHWDFMTPHFFDSDIPVKRWMAFPE